MTGPSNLIRKVASALEPSGIQCRGVVNLVSGDAPSLKDGSRARSVLLLGNVGGSIWPAFAKWRKTYRGPNPLDTWSEFVIGPVADELGATAYFPSDQPWKPFQQWAMKAEGLRLSPLGILIHPDYGLWHGYRGALGFPVELPQQEPVCVHACDGCGDKPCLKACPVGAIGVDLNVSACRSFLKTVAGRDSCIRRGCLARAACPVGASYIYPDAQVRFHMRMLEA